MKKILFLAVSVSISLINPQNVFADRVCNKISLRNGRVTQSVRTVIGNAACPRGFTQLVNTATLVGPQGATGAAGAPGPVGATGNPGATGPTSFALPSGESLTGAVVLTFTADTGGEVAGEYAQFSRTVPTELPTQIVGVGGAPTTECPGSVGNPQALAGNLCIYLSSTTNVGFAATTSGPSGLGSMTNTHGFFMQISSGVSGFTALLANWIVTAP